MREHAVAIAVGVLFAGGVVAHAATLGPAQAASLGADDVAVADCNAAGVALRHQTNYDAAAGTYVVTGVVVDGLGAHCAGRQVAVTLRSSDGAAIAQADTVVVPGPATVTFAAGASAQAVAGASVVVF